MNHIPKDLSICSKFFALLLGAAVTAGCTVTTTPGEPDLTPTANPDGGGPTEQQPSAGSGCDFGEPNDTREQATPIALDRVYSNLCVSSPEGTDELDFFELTAPASDLAGGVVEVRISNVKSGGLAEIVITSVVDNGVVLDGYTTDRGANVSGWLSVSPGAKYRIQVNRFGGTGDRFAYDLVTRYTAIKDVFEPNNTKQEAKTLEVNTPVQASAAAHSPKASLDAGDGDDWFTITLGAGAATVKVTNVAPDHLCDVQLFDGAGQEIDERYQVTPGADCVLAATELKGGDYVVKLSTFSGPPLRGEPNKPVPAFLLQSYTLEVQQ